MRSPDWLDAPRLRRPGLRAVIAVTILSGAGASAAAYVFLDSPAEPSPPAAPAAPPPRIAAAEPAPEPALAPPVRLVLEPEPPAKQATSTGRRELHLRLPSGTGASLAARWIRVGNRFAVRGAYRPALKAFEHAAGVDVHSADAWYGIALCDYELKRDAASDKAAAQALFEDPAHAMANLLSGFLSQQGGDPAKARQFYDRYLAREPNGPYAEEVVSVLEQLPE